MKLLTAAEVAAQLRVPQTWVYTAARTGSFPLAISMLSLIYVVGLPLIALAPETAGKPLAK